MLIIESDYDKELLASSVRYTSEMKRRISGKYGHLSNDDAAEFVADHIESGGEKTHVWLAHISEETNSPTIAKARTTELLHKALGIDKNIEATLRDVPSLTWSSE